MKNSIWKFGAELLCIFIAVTASFYLDELRDKRSDRETLKSAVASLIIDIEIFERDYHEGSQFASDGMSTIDSCLTLTESGHNVPRITLQEVLYYIGNDHSFGDATSAAYTGLLQSHVWYQVPDSLQRMIFQLYGTDYGYVKVAVEQFSRYSAAFKQRYYPSMNFCLLNKLGDTHRFESKGDSLGYLAVQRAFSNQEFRSSVIVLRNQYNKVVRYQRAGIVASRAAREKLGKYLNEL